MKKSELVEIIIQLNPWQCGPDAQGRRLMSQSKSYLEALAGGLTAPNAQYRTEALARSHREAGALSRRRPATLARRRAAQHRRRLAA